MRETRTLRRDDRGVSTTVTYSLTVLITTILVAGLIYSASTTVKTEREQAAANELTVVGERLVREIVGMDALVDAGEDTTARMRVDHPRRVVGATYTVTLQPGGGDPCESTDRPCLVLVAEELDVTATMPFKTATNTSLVNTTVQGGELVVVYEDGEVAVEER